MEGLLVTALPLNHFVQIECSDVGHGARSSHVTMLKTDLYGPY